MSHGSSKMRSRKSRAAWDHPGLLHLYVHLMEMSPCPERALRAGDRLRAIVPNSGHLIHMPTHLDILCGHYNDVLVYNQKALVTDRKFLAATADPGVYGLVNGVFFRAVQLFVTPKAARVGIVLVCFPLAGLAMALLRSPVSHVDPAATCASWLAMGAGYQLMTHLAARVDRALLNGLQRIQAGY